MSAQLKHAWFNLVVYGTAIVLTLIAGILGLVLVGPRNAQAAFAFLGIAGLGGLGGIFYKKKPGSEEVLMDERDIQIRERAHLMAWNLVWLYWGALCMGTWLVVALRSGDPTRSISLPISALALIYMAAMILHQFVCSVVIVVQYRGWHHEG